MYEEFHSVSHDMMKKMKTSKPRHLPWFGFKIVIALCFLSYCLFAYLKLHSQVKLPSLYPVYHTSPSLGYHHFEGTPKIAFLFLARRDLPLDFLWDSFFKVIWGESSMIEAEKLLLLAALHDPANQRFVLLSDSCVPLYNFNYLYSYLISSPKSFVDSFIDVEEDRYSPKMSPIIPKDKWRKGSQRWPPKDVDNRKENRQLFDLARFFLQSFLWIFKQHRNCIPDEHYVQTLLAMNGLEDELERRTLTYTMWNHSITKTQTPWHPITFDYDDVSAKKIKEIKVINSISHEHGNRSEMCRVNNIHAPCFLFARKFTYRAALRLLTLDLVGLYDPTASSNIPP